MTNDEGMTNDPPSMITARRANDELGRMRL
jgi:hypothetical protein